MLRHHISDAVSEQESLFTYNGSKSWSDYNTEIFMPLFLDEIENWDPEMYVHIISNDRYTINVHR